MHRILALMILLPACSNRAPQPETAAAGPASKSPEATSMSDTVHKTPEEWRAQLTPEQYHVAREKGTERAFTGKYWDAKAKGIYECVCCGRALFSSETKYRSGTGWPSFYEPVDPEAVTEVADRTLGTVRTEVVCSRCDAHLGHVFDDGPDPTGQRYCLNSASLHLEPAKPAPETKAAKEKE